MRTVDFAPQKSTAKIEDVETTTDHSSITTDQSSTEVSWRPDDVAGEGEFHVALMDASRPLTEMVEEAIALHRSGKTRKFPE